MEVLRGAAEGGRAAGRPLVGAARAARRAARGLRDRDGRARRRGAGRRQPGRAARRWSASLFVLLQVLAPIHTATGANLGDSTAAWLYDRLTRPACVLPPGMGHLEDPKLTGDLTVARDFDLGMIGPPLVDVAGLHRGRPGRDGRRHRVSAHPVSASRGGRRLVLGGAWLSTH